MDGEKKKKTRNGTAWIGLISVIIIAIMSVIGDKTKITDEEVLIAFATLLMVASLATTLIVLSFMLYKGCKKRIINRRKKDA